MSKPNNTQLADIASYMAQNITVPQLVQHYDKSMIFSTDEVMVGQWIDKRPIYKKTLTFTVPTTSTDGTASSALNISIGASVNEIVDIQFTMYIDGFGWNNEWANAVASNKVNKVIILPYCNANGTVAKRNTVDITSYQRVASGANGYLTLYYTKTTDSPVDYVPVGGCEPRFQSATTFDQNNPTNCIIRYTSGDGADLLDADSLLLYQKSASTQESTADYVEVNTAKYTYDLFNTITVDSSAGFMNLTPLQNIPMKIVFSKNSIATRVIYGSIPVILHT